MKKALRKLLFFAVLLAIMFVLNPSLKKHQNAIDEAFRAENQLVGALGAGKLVANVVDYNDMFIFSYTDVDNEIISIGMFGMVKTKNLDLLSEK